MDDGAHEAGLAELEHAFGAPFHDRRLLQQAFVHRSYLNENPSFALPSNERLEFLGDAVLGFVAADLLYKRFPTLSEGELTRLRASIVRAETLAHLARALNLGRHMFLGRGEEASGGRKRQTLLAATFEAVVGAAYLDLGLDVAAAFLRHVLEPELERVLSERTEKDYKSRLQELVQARWQMTPGYVIVATIGPEHLKTFTVAVQVGEQVLGQGSGRSKQEAEQDAARQALEVWDAD